MNADKIAMDNKELMERVKNQTDAANNLLSEGDLLNNVSDRNSYSCLLSVSPSMLISSCV